MVLKFAESLRVIMTINRRYRLARIIKISEPFLLLCEGKHDSEFFLHLIVERGLPPFDVCSASFASWISHQHWRRKYPLH